MKKFLLLIIFLFSSFSLFSADKVRIEDIKIEGLQRVEPGLVFDNIPFEIDDFVEDVDFSKSIQLLYKTGQFKNITIELEGNDVIIVVNEKAIIAEINFHNTDTFQPDKLKEGIASYNVAEGLVLNLTELKKVEKELINNYLASGKYSASIQTKVTPLERNRVVIDFFVDEGTNSRIKEIKFIGISRYDHQVLRDQMTLKTTNLLSWWEKDDRYSKQILTGDLEKIRSFYMDRGYLDFKIENTTVSISESKRNVYISIVFDEGAKYKFGEIKISGNYYPLKEEELTNELEIIQGGVFSRKLVILSTDKINSKFGTYGFAFSNVNPIPQIDKEKLTVGFNFFVEPGQKVYVRRINFIGNVATKDKVIRRELRQLESSWYAKDKIDRSKARLTRTQYFDNVDIQTASVPGSSDQIDLNVMVVERNTGSIKVGAGLSSSDGIVGTLDLSQTNFVGTGNTVSLSVSTSSINKVYSLEYTDPYFTDDGISRSFQIYTREINTKDIETGNYDSKSMGGGVGFGVPVSEHDRINFGFYVDMTDIKLKTTSPTRYQDYCNQVSGGNTSGCDTNEAKFTMGYQTDNRDNALMPTEGHKYRLQGEVSIPALDMQYYKIEAIAKHYLPVSNSLTWSNHANIAYGDSYGDDPYPFFKNYYVGGQGSVRGYKQSSIGKKFFDSNATVNDWVSYGGTSKLILSSELYFPLPGLKMKDSVRTSVFIDGGGVWGENDEFELGEMRYSAGVGILWVSPFGPLKVSLAQPLNKGNRDKDERFQFGMGTNF